MSLRLVFYLIVCLLIAIAVWMLSYGLILQLLWKDGRILKMTIATAPLAPLFQLMAYPSSRSLQLAAAGAIVPSVLVASIVALVGFRRPASPLGDAAFQDLASLRHGKWLRKRGHIFGRAGHRMLRHEDDRHHLIIGPTRSGKGVGYVIPNALVFAGSMIVTDLKGEIFEFTAGYRKMTGHQVFLFSPGAPRSHRWNPLDFIRSDRGSRTIDIQNMASILVPEAIGSENAVWQGIAQQVIAGLISYVLESLRYKNRRNLGEVNSLLNAGVDLQTLMKEIKDNEPALSRFTNESFNAYIALNERAARSALLDIQRAFAPFRNERVIAATAVTDIDFGSLQRRPVTIYLAPNISDMTVLRPLLTLFVQQVMDLLTRERNPGSVPVYFLLDEFRQLKRMDEVMNRLPYVAGYNIKMAFVVQGIKNLDEIYGETARHSLLGNCGLQLILGANDQVTSEYVSRALGKRTIRFQTESRSLEPMGLTRRTKVEQIRERDLMMPQEIRQMPEHKIVLLVEGQRPIFGDKLRYHTTQPFQAASNYAREHQPEVPELDSYALHDVPALMRNPGSTIGIPSEQDVRHVADEPSITIAADIPEKIARSLKTGRTSAHWDNERFGAKVSPNSSLKQDFSGAEARVIATAAKLKSTITTSLKQSPRMPAKARQSIEDIFAQTIPDPAELGVELRPEI